MTRYTSIETPGSYQSSRRQVLSASRRAARVHPMSGGPILGLHCDMDDPSEKQRRRIAVACSRCRKRKIKCSGDPKNGQGCQNCRNAGTDPSQCQFLRVSSTTIEYPSDWPYLVGSAPTCSGNPPLTIYGFGSMSAGVGVSQGNPANRRFASAWSYSQPSIIGSNDYYPYEFPIGEPLYSASYGLQQPSQSYFGGNEHATGTHNCGDVLRQWHGLPRMDRLSPNGFEQNTGNLPFGSTGIAHPTPLAPLSIVDPTSGFPSMGILAKTLPPSNSISDRILPVPRAITPNVESDNSINLSQPPCGELLAALGRPLPAWNSDRTSIAPHLAVIPISAISSEVSLPTCAKSLSSSSINLNTSTIYGSRVESSTDTCTSCPELPISTSEFTHSVPVIAKIASAAELDDQTTLYSSPMPQDLVTTTLPLSKPSRGQTSSTNGLLAYNSNISSNTPSKQRSGYSSATDATACVTTEMNRETTGNHQQLRQIRPAQTQMQPENVKVTQTMTTLKGYIDEKVSRSLTPHA